MFVLVGICPFKEKKNYLSMRSNITSQKNFHHYQILNHSWDNWLNITLNFVPQNNLSPSYHPLGEKLDHMACVSLPGNPLNSHWGNKSMRVAIVAESNARKKKSNECMRATMKLTQRKLRGRPRMGIHHYLSGAFIC
jgi:hypothetical protein